MTMQNPKVTLKPGEEFWPIAVSASHYLENLSGEQYASPDECNWELVKNAVQSHMPDDEVWRPELADVSIYIVDKHPLSPNSKALIILDHGRGFTDVAIQRFCFLGRRENDNAGRNGHGVSQKRIGRFAAFALNRVCFEQPDGAGKHTGFYILTRTSSSGSVRYIPMIPANLEAAQGTITRTIKPDDIVMCEPLKGIKGSFTAIVIANSVFDDYNQIRRGLEWKLPRKAKQCFKLTIGGQKLDPPPLADEVTISEQGNPNGIEVFSKASDPEGDDPNTHGIWFTDKKTGIRVAHAPRLMRHLKTYPLWHLGVTGDVFVHNALANQDTSRTTFNSSYLCGKTWKHKVLPYLNAHVVPKTRALLDEDDVVFSGSNVFSETLLEFVEDCRNAFGVPEGGRGVLLDEDLGEGGSRPRPTPGTENGNGTKVHGGHGGGHVGNGGGEGSRPRRRSVPLRIGDMNLVVTRRQLAPKQLAMVDAISGMTLYLNDAYKLMPPRKERRSEHFRLMVLGAVATHLHNNNTETAFEWISTQLESLRGAVK